MKAVFEHANRKTTVFGDDYATIIDKIRELFPEETSRVIEFYDPELCDYFDFTSFEQIKDHPNGLKMRFDTSLVSDLLSLDTHAPSVINDNQNSQRNTNAKINNCTKRSRKKSTVAERIEPPSLPVYGDIITQGLQSRESFQSIQQEFLHKTSSYFLQEYPNCTSRKAHHAFIMALIQQYPALNYLDKNIDGIDGKAPYHTISRLLSRKKRNMRYSKNHPAPKRARQNTSSSTFNDKVIENVIIEENPTVAIEKNIVFESNQNVLVNGCSTEESLNESNISQTIGSPSVQLEKSVTTPSSPNTCITSRIVTKTNRQATVVSVTSSRTSNSPNQSSSTTSSIINVPSVSSKPVIIKPATITNTPANFIYHNGRLQVNSFPIQSVVSVHKAIAPRKCEKKKKKENDTGPPVTIAEEPTNVLKESNVNNIVSSSTTNKDDHRWFLKLSNSEISSYNKDVARLRTIVKLKNKAAKNISSVEIHVLIRNTHFIRRQKLLEKEKDDFQVKVFDFQEIFHEDALVYEYMLLKNRTLTFEELQAEVRITLDNYIEKYALQKHEKMSEIDFVIMSSLCKDAGEENLIFKNVLCNPDQIIGILITSSSTNEFEKAFMFIRNLPFKIYLSIDGGGLQSVLAILITVYINLNAQPDHAVLRMLLESCNKKK